MGVAKNSGVGVGVGGCVHAGGGGDLISVIRLDGARIVVQPKERADTFSP